jgi:hypothetical protein
VSKPISPRNGMAALGRTPVFPKAKGVGGLSAQLRRPQPRSAMSAKRRLRPSVAGVISLLRQPRDDEELVVGSGGMPSLRSHCLRSSQFFTQLHTPKSAARWRSAMTAPSGRSEPRFPQRLNNLRRYAWRASLAPNHELAEIRADDVSASRTVLDRFEAHLRLARRQWRRLSMVGKRRQHGRQQQPQLSRQPDRRRGAEEQQLKAQAL